MEKHATEYDPQQPARRRTDRSLPIALLRAREAVMGPIRVMLASSGVNEQKWRVLRVLDEAGPMEQTAIAEAACLLLPSLSQILPSLEKEGMVQRATDPTDRRRTIVSVTERGRSVIRSHLAESEKLFARLEQEFGRRKLETLLELLEDLRRVKL